MPPKKQNDTKVSQESTAAPEVVSSTNGSESPAEPSQIEKLIARLDAQDEEIKILRKVVPQNQLARLTPKKTIGRSIRIPVHKGKRVIRWCDLSEENNDVDYGGDVKTENQIMTLEIEDGTEVKCRIKDFSKIIQSKWVDVDLNKSTFIIDEDTGKPTPMVKEYFFNWNGKEASIEHTFINP